MNDNDQIIEDAGSGDEAPEIKIEITLKQKPLALSIRAIATDNHGGKVFSSRALIEQDLDAALGRMLGRMIRDLVNSHQNP